MSTIIMSKCWPLQMPPTQKSVLISLADNANDEGICWPAISTIAMRTCFKERAVQNAIRWLEDHDALVKDMRTGTSTRYILTPDLFKPQEIEGGVQEMHPPVEAPGASDAPPHQVHPSGASDAPPPPHQMHPEPSSEPSKEPSLVASPCFLKIPLIRKDGDFEVTEAMVAEWQETFPGIDVKLVLRKIRAWNFANETRRKTRKGIVNHIIQWLGKEQDRAKPGTVHGGAQVRDESCRYRPLGAREICGMPGRADPVYGYLCEGCRRKVEEARSSNTMPDGVRSQLRGVLKRGAAVT